jgi:glycosyltransferase involved in cell wall biosynthesis
MSRKKRVLLVSEFSLLSTGFATYTNEVMSRLFNTGKYELAELACYVDPTNPKLSDVPWKVYPNQPHPQDKQAHQAFNSVRANVFGRWKFDEVCIDFKPDYVLMLRDYWMDFWITESPLRNRFNIINMPTVDGEPQKQEWMEFYKNCEVILTYSHFGKSVLEKQSGGKIKVADVASPGADLDLFKPPLDKRAHKESFGINGDSIIFQTVMRNQPRKLFPDLMRAFSTYLQYCVENNRSDLAHRSFLWLHTASPDVGWDIAEEIKRHNLSHKVLITYRCEECGHYFPSFWMGERCFCPKCGKFSVSTPNSMNGISKEALGQVMQCADIYVQFSSSEGFGICPNDAKACGVPVISVAYSAMLDHAYNGGGVPCKLKALVQEPITQTDQIRAFPDHKHCAALMVGLAVDEEYRIRLGMEGRRTVEEYYNWDRVARCWERAIDDTPIKSGKDSWDSPYTPINTQGQLPNNVDNTDFVKYICSNILGNPSLTDTIKWQKEICNLNNGYEFIENEGGQRMVIQATRERLIEKVKGIIQRYNSLEYLRCHKPEQVADQPNQVRMVVI